MTETKIRAKDNGPYTVTGNFELVDADGGRFSVEQETIALCRCGHSETKPFCDGTHKKIGFEAAQRASEAG